MTLRNQVGILAFGVRDASEVALVGLDHHVAVELCDDFLTTHFVVQLGEPVRPERLAVLAVPQDEVAVLRHRCARTVRALREDDRRDAVVLAEHLVEQEG